MIKEVLNLVTHFLDFWNQTIIKEDIAKKLKQSHFRLHLQNHPLQFLPWGLCTPSLQNYFGNKGLRRKILKEAKGIYGVVLQRGASCSKNGLFSGPLMIWMTKVFAIAYWHYTSNICQNYQIMHWKLISTPDYSHHWRMVPTIHQSPQAMLPIHPVATVDGQTIQHLIVIFSASLHTVDPNPYKYPVRMWAFSNTMHPSMKRIMGICGLNVPYILGHWMDG